MKDSTRLFSALADDTRLRMVALLLDQELCVCDVRLALGITQSRASRNLGILEKAGLLKSRRSGKWVYYSLAPHRSSPQSYGLIRFLKDQLGWDNAVLKDRKRLAQVRRPGSGRPPC